MKNFTALVSLGLTAVPPAARNAAATQALADVMKAMPYTGNADVDFVTKMILHHRGAVNMAKLELKHGKNPKVRKLAENILKSQSHQLVEMDAWLANYRTAPAN